MKISQSEFAVFQALPRPEGYRFGQAWFNFFNLQRHNPVDDAERVLLDRIYNEKDPKQARAMIEANFIDPAQ